MLPTKFDIDAALDSIDLTFSNYIPSQDALEFFNLIRVFFGEDFEVPNPLLHYFIVDCLYGNITREQFPYSEEINKTLCIDPSAVTIIASRGTAKSTITTLFYPIVAAIKGRLPVTGPLSHILILSDSQKGGARDQALIMGSAFEKSVFAKEWFESIRATETEVEVVRKGNEPIEKRHMLIKFKGAQALSLDTVLHTDSGTITMGDVKVGDKIFDPDGVLTTVTAKSDVLYRPMYLLQLLDGRQLKVSEDHLNAVIIDGVYHVMDTESLLKEELVEGHYYRVYVPNSAPVQHSKKPLPIAPKAYAKVVVHNEGRIAPEYRYSSIEDRTELLNALIGADTVVVKRVKESAANMIAEIGRSLGYSARVHETDGVYLVFINRDEKDDAIVSITPISVEPSQCIAVNNRSRLYLAGSYIPTHNTGGIRSGSRNPVTHDRYGLICADDVIKNEAEAYSETIMKNVTTALTSDAENAMRSKNTQFVMVNTPFHKNDPIYRTMESGGVTPILAPICKEISLDIPKEEWVGVWEAQHSYESVMKRYTKAVSLQQTRSFNQELMLRVSNEEDRLVKDHMIQWYDRTLLLRLLNGYSLYVTTDFTTTGTAKSDFSAGALWAISSNYDYFLLDFFLEKQELDQQYNSVFRLVFGWNQGGRAIEVGVETDGQQKAHMFALKQQMQMTNRYFSFAKQKGAPAGREGIQSGSVGNKHERFRFFLPNFHNSKVYFPEQLRDTPMMKEALKQLKGVTSTGFSYSDDFCDAVSQLGLIDIIAGTGSYEPVQEVAVDADNAVAANYWNEVLREDDDDSGYGSTVF